MVTEIRQNVWKHRETIGSRVSVIHMVTDTVTAMIITDTVNVVTRTVILMHIIDIVIWIYTVEVEDVVMIMRV